jgi:hypothetical protein
MGADTVASDRDVLFLFYWLLDQSGHGWFSSERAAWLIQSGGGHELKLWPFSPKERQATWPDLKSIPAGTVAQAHTHPAGTDPRPSSHGKENDFKASVTVNTVDGEIRRALPIYTISRSAIWKLTPPPARAVVQVGFAGWWKPFEDDLRALKAQQQQEKRLERLEAKFRRKLARMR